MRVGLGLMMVLGGCAATSQDLVIDRFSARAGHLQVRTAANGLPGPGKPVDFDHAPLITQSRGPAGELIRYYNFDVQSTSPSVYYELVDAARRAITDQAPIVDAVPGDPTYSDFVRRIEVTVPAHYHANELRDVRALLRSGYALRDTGTILNRPIVPPGSVARERMRGGAATLERGWYRGKRVSWFRFDETELAPDRGQVPTSPIYVTFNKNPGEPGGGPATGFRLEADGVQTHNVASSVPGDLDYSPLWLVSVYDNASFLAVHDEATVLAARIVAPHVATVNCPIVFVGAGTR